MPLSVDVIITAIYYVILSIADPPQKINLAWSEEVTCQQTQVIPFIGHPFILLSGRWSKDCNFGPDRNAYNKEKNKCKRSSKLNSDHSQSAVRREQLHKGHKVNCPAKILVKEVFVFTQVEVPKFMYDRDLW